MFVSVVQRVVRSFLTHSDKVLVSVDKSGLLKESSNGVCIVSGGFVISDAAASVLDTDGSGGGGGGFADTEAIMAGVGGGGGGTGRPSGAIMDGVAVEDVAAKVGS